MKNKTTSRQLVIKALEFDSPSRVPRQLWLWPWTIDNFGEDVKKIQRDFPDDITICPQFYKTPLTLTGDMYSVGTFIDEWGCEFENNQKGLLGHLKKPVINDWPDMKSLTPPIDLLSVDIEKVNDFCKNTDKFVLSPCLANPFERLGLLRGAENLYIDLASDSDEFKELLEIVHRFFLDQINLWASTEIDGIFFMDDWGSQTSLLISPIVWRKIFKPLYKEYIDIAHAHGKKIFMHSDGYITDIIPDLIEIGLDALNSQLFCMDIEQLAKEFKGKITFWGEIDRQKILSQGSTQDVIDAVELVKRSFIANGGVIAQCEFTLGAKPQNVYTVFQQWNK